MKKMSILTLMLLQLVVASGQTGLMVSELMYQPRSGEAEYVELYNGMDAAVQLGDYEVVRWLNDTLGQHYQLPAHVVGPHEYVVLTRDAGSVMSAYVVKYASRIVECTLPPYPNAGGSVIICRAADGVIVDRFDYLPSMHSRLLRNKAGVSLERRSFERPCNEAGNWFSAASTAGYGTPTLPNSQSMEYVAEEASFAFSSKLLSPDDDGYQDELTIEYTLEDGDVYASIDIYDAAGRPVCRLLNNALLGTHGTIVWNGMGEGGSALRQGRYALIIKLYNLQGTRQTLRRTVAIIAP